MISVPIRPSQRRTIWKRTSCVITTTRSSSPRTSVSAIPAGFSRISTAFRNARLKIKQIYLKRQCHEIFDLRFFYESVSPKSPAVLLIPVVHLDCEYLREFLENFENDPYMLISGACVKKTWSKKYCDTVFLTGDRGNTWIFVNLLKIILHVRTWSQLK
jgi:hypothetical protein